MDKETREKLRTVSEILERANRMQDAFSKQLAAQQLVLIGVMRALRNNPDATLQVERSIAEFAKKKDPRHTEIIDTARTILNAGYEDEDPPITDLIPDEGP